MTTYYPTVVDQDTYEIDNRDPLETWINHGKFQVRVYPWDLVVNVIENCIPEGPRQDRLIERLLELKDEIMSINDATE